MNLSLPQREVLSALVDLLPRGGGRVSQLDIRDYVGLGLSTIADALSALERQGIISRKAPQGIGPATRIVLGNVSYLEQFQQGPYVSPLPECFRVRDLRAKGHLWNRSPKGVWLTKAELSEYAVTSSGTLSKHLQEMLAWPVLALSTKPNPDMPHRRLYMLHALADEQLSDMLAWASGRLKQWQPITGDRVAVEREAARDSFSRRFGTRAYAHHAPEILANTIVSEGPTLEQVIESRGALALKPHAAKGPCLLYQGDRTSDGYGIVPGIPEASGVRAHRVVYWHEVREIPEDQEVHHLCKVRNCVEPKHLRALHADDHRRNFTAWDSYYYRRQQAYANYPHGNDEQRAAIAAAEETLAKHTALDTPIGTVRPTTNH